MVTQVSGYYLYFLWIELMKVLTIELVIMIFVSSITGYPFKFETFPFQLKFFFGKKISTQSKYLAIKRESLFLDFLLILKEG
jgi:hypothetical protein